MSLSRRRGSAKVGPKAKGDAAPGSATPLSEADARRFVKAPVVKLLLALTLLELGPESVDVVLADDLGGDDDQAVRRNERFVSFEIFRHVLHALVAPLIGLLD